jgi:gliding motility-associated-like protein
MRRTVPMYIHVLGVFLSASASQAQQAFFTLPDSVCENTQVQIVNTTMGATRFNWSFSPPTLDSAPEAVNLGLSAPYLARPIYMDYAEEDGIFYGFVINNGPGGLVELNFGNSLTNMPVYTFLGNIDGTIPDVGEGIQLIKDAGEWYAIVTGETALESSRIARIDLGSSLSSIKPVGTNWGNVGGLLGFPHKLQLIQIEKVWYGFVLNFSYNTITEFNFGTSLASPPIAVDLPGIKSLNVPTGFYIVQQNGSWYMFITNEGNNTLTRLDFGPSLLNPHPSEINLGDPNGTLSGPRDITLVNLCNQVEALVVNDKTSDVVLLNFPAGIAGAPSARSLGNMGGMDYPVSISSIFSLASDLYAFIPNVNNNSISRLTFHSSNAAIPNSSLRTPPAFSYSSPGTYNINLLTNVGLITQSSYCKTIVAVPPPVVDLGSDTSVCLTSSYVLTVKDPLGACTYKWQDSTMGPAYTVSAQGLYTVAASVSGCTKEQSIYIRAIPLPDFSLGEDQPILPGDVIYLKPDADSLAYVWGNGSTDTTLTVTQPGTYYVTGSNICGSYRDSVTIYKGIALHVPNAFTPNGDGVNDQFKVVGTEQVDHFDMNIYSRWGKKVFESQDKSHGWDGTVNGISLPVGAYAYDLHFRYSDSGKYYEMRGTVLLML